MTNTKPACRPCHKKAECWCQNAFGKCPTTTSEAGWEKEFDSLVSDYEENHKWFPTFKIQTRNLFRTELAKEYARGLKEVVARVLMSEQELDDWVKEHPNAHIVRIEKLPNGAYVNSSEAYARGRKDAVEYIEAHAVKDTFIAVGDIPKEFRGETYYVIPDKRFKEARHVDNTNKAV